PPTRSVIQCSPIQQQRIKSRFLSQEGRIHREREREREREYYGIKGQSFAFAPKCYDIWFAGYLSYWGKIFDKNELWQEEKLRTLIRDCFASLQSTPARRSLLTKLAQPARGRL